MDVRQIIEALGTKATDAATGVVSTSKYFMAYIKQIVTAVIAIKERTDLIPDDPADQSEIIAEIDENEAKIDTIDGVVDAIKAKTDNLPSDPADQSLLVAEIAALVTDYLNHGTHGLAALEAFVDCLPAALGDIVEKNEAGVIDNIWDEALTGATHNVATSAGRRLRQVAGAVIRAETAQAGDSTHITLDADASSTDDIYNVTHIVIVAGTGVGQGRHIMDYDGTSKIAEVYPAWVTNPSSDSEYVIFSSAMTHLHIIEQDGLDQINAEVDAALSDYGAALASVLGALNAATASGAVDDATVAMGYLKQIVTAILNGTYGLAALQTLLAAITAAGPTLTQMNTAHALLATPAQVATALNTYDAVKRSEATSDKDEIIGMIIALGG